MLDKINIKFRKIIILYILREFLRKFNLKFEKFVILKHLLKFFKFKIRYVRRGHLEIGVLGFLGFE